VENCSGILLHLVVLTSYPNPKAPLGRLFKVNFQKHDTRRKAMAKKESKEVAPQEPGRSLFPLDEMEQWFGDFFRRPFFGPPWFPQIRFPRMGEVSPAVDLFEEGNDVVVKAEIPGVKKEDLDVNISGDTITISGEKKTEEKVERKDFYHLERSVGSFTRKFRIPVGTQTDKAKASFKDGVLEIRIPKTAAAKEKVKKITIQ
jgi:HSP20 family protein